MIFKKLRSIISEELNVPEGNITMDTSFQDDLNADSLDVFQIIMAIEEEFQIEVSDDEAEGITTVEAVVEYLKNTKGLD